MIKTLIPVFISFLIIQNSNAQDSLITPPNPEGLTKIYISIVINNISEINAASEIMQADIYLAAKWNDPRLKHEGAESELKNFNNAWGPLITISNRLNISKSFAEDIFVSNDGTATYFQRIFGGFTQKFEFKDFPFDTQTFDVKIIGMGNTAKDIELVPDPEVKSGISDDLSLPEWNILDWKYDNTPYTLMKGTPELPALTFSFRAKRESGFYLLVFVIPLVLIIIMSWTSFWLDPKLSSSQISIATTSMLTLIAYRFVVSGGLPKISYMTRMDIFVLGSSILIFITLLQTVLTTSLTSRGKEILGNKIDVHCRWIFPLLYIFVCLVAFVF